MNRTKTPPSTVKSASRVAAILFLLGSPPGQASLTEVAVQLRIPKSSAHALLHTLLQEGVLTTDQEGRYRLNPRLLAVAANMYSRLDIRVAGTPVARELSSRFQATCNLAILEDGQVVYVEQIRDESHPMQIATHIGAAIPAHATALGKVLVAGHPEAKRADWLRDHEYNSLTPRTINSRSQMEAAIEECLNLGYAIDDEELHEGVFCIAAPIFNHRSQTVGAISLTTIKSRLFRDGEVSKEMAAMEVMRAGSQISAGLGWCGTD